MSYTSSHVIYVMQGNIVKFSLHGQQLVYYFHKNSEQDYSVETSKTKIIFVSKYFHLTSNKSLLIRK